MKTTRQFAKAIKSIKCKLSILPLSTKSKGYYESKNLELGKMCVNYEKMSLTKLLSVRQQTSRNDIQRAFKTKLEKV